MALQARFIARNMNMGCRKKVWGAGTNEHLLRMSEALQEKGQKIGNNQKQESLKNFFLPSIYASKSTTS
ncbi:unnamed protein product [Sphenostylis stenocarpa]|uniref:Uncharacterized protein n=1 Tax=Sphenostylis stenocarpa TaxID=92480 RepID=A0AA86SFL1_9FABA|nr:unnamed protein product [Sphenostylis stenocarpa]